MKRFLITALVAGAAFTYAGPEEHYAGSGTRPDRRHEDRHRHKPPTVPSGTPTIPVTPPAIAPAPDGQTFSRPSSTFSTAPGSFSRPAPAGLHERVSRTIPPESLAPPQHKPHRPHRPHHPHRRHHCGPRCGHGQHYPTVVYYYGGYYEPAGILDGFVPTTDVVAQPPEPLPQPPAPEPEVQAPPPVVIDLPPGARILRSVPAAATPAPAPVAAPANKTPAPPAAP